MLRLDADEVLSEDLAKEIEAIKQNPDCDGYKLRIGDVYPGIPRPFRWAKHYKLIRLYNRKKMKMLGILDHDAVDPLVPNVRIRTLHGFVCHHSYLNMAHLIAKQNRATDTQIRMLIKGQKRYPPPADVGD